MQTSILKLSLLSLLFISLISVPARSNEKNINFSVNTSNIYFPGDNVSINIYSYDYSEKDDKRFKQTFTISVFKIKDINAFYSKQIGRYGIEVLSKDSSNLLYLTEKVYSFKKTLKSENDYGYTYINESVPVDVKSKGAYLVQVIAGNKVAYCGFVISELGLVSKAGNNSMLAFVVDRKTGNPVSNTDLSFYLGTTKIGEGKTNEGIFYQQVNDEVKGDKDEDLIPMIIGRNGEDIVISDAYLYFGYSSGKYYTYIFTEQPVYRTGSEVNFKGTIRKNVSSGLEPLSDKEVTVVIKDAKNAEVYKQVLTTNKMGSFDGKYKIDDEAAIGNYTIFANIDEGNSYSATFSVEQYKKPEYKVTVITDKSQYYGKDNLSADIEAKYYFGSPVADADVEYNIYKVRYYKPWWMFSEYAWWYRDYYENMDENQMYSGSEFIFSGTGKLDSDGKLKIGYRIDEDFKNKGKNSWYRSYSNESDYKYIIQAKVVDKSRREISGTTSAFVTRGGFSISANTDKYLYKPDEKVNIEVYASDFADKPVETAFEATIYRSTWSSDYYKESRVYVKSISGKTRSDGKGIMAFDVPGTDAEGSYTVEVKAKDERSNEITAGVHFYVSKGNDLWWYRNETGGIQIIPDKESYKQGEVCRALILTTNPGVTALITTNTDDVLFYSVEKISAASMIVEIPITEKYTSGFEINVNYVYDGTFHNSSKNVLVVPEEKFLTVVIDASKLIYKPKETGDVRVRVVDNNGNPVRNAEVSIGIVDESIYAIKGDNTKDIRKFFYGRKNSDVSTTYSNVNSSNGQSRLITIYEKFNLKSTSNAELGTIKGRLLRKDNSPIPGAIIVIDEDFQAAITDQDGNFEFKLPSGNYSIGVYYSGITKDDLVDLHVEKGRVKNITLYNNRELNDKSGLDDLTLMKDIPAPGEIQFRAGRTMEESERMMDGAVLQSTRKMKRDFDEKKNGELVSADVRSDFRDAIFWSPYTITDADGYAHVSVTYPDNLTTWRITSRVITSDTKVGEMTSTVITRKDLLVRMETPRFMQQNDVVTISTIIHNYLETTKNTTVRFKVENAMLEGIESEKKLEIAPDSDVRLDWRVKVTNPMGEAKLYAEALTNEESDAVEVKVPLQPKGLQVNVNTIADFSDEFKTETKFVNIPENSDLRATGLKFTVDPSLASTILTALDELVGYPYGCVEQTMSRFLPTIVVANAFIQLNAPISKATKKDLPKMVDKGLQRLYGFQHSDGGWGWWENDQTNPFMTAYVVYGLSLARQADYEIKDNVLNRGISSIKDQLNSADSKLDPTTRAYMLYALAVAEEKDKDFFERQIQKVTAAGMNDYARSLIAMTWKMIGNSGKAKEVLYSLEKNAKSTGEGAAYWEGKQFHYQWQDDKVQTTAMALKAIVGINSGSELKDKVVRWLMMQRQGMSWRNTQETAMIIYSMVDYLKTSNELAPNYNVKVFINGENVFEKNMTRDNVFSKEGVVKIDNKLLKAGANEIRIEKSGTGKVYFSSYTTYFLDDENISAKEDGFRVEREYYRLEKYNVYNEDKITYRKKYFDGNVKSGDDILVKLRVYSKDENNQYFMLEDALPSGFEVIKDDWAYQIEDENDYRGSDYYYWRWWYADKEVRDNRVSFFVTYLGKGEYEFTYLMHAQIPGEYSVNPARGMLMYYPEVNGSTGSARFNVTD